MVYSAGKQDHTIAADDMINHVVDLVEERVAAIEAEEARAKQEGATPELPDMASAN
jgi:(E)-4-hydroxy-3-methylbut-2-enyl-diphosphate synthase